MAEAAAHRKYQVPTGVTLDAIHKATRTEIKEMTQLFTPPVSTKKCSTLEEQKERLRCAYRKAAGKAKDIDAFACLMEDLNRSDSARRNELLQYCQMLSSVLHKLQDCDDKLIEHLDLQATTRDINGRIETTMKSLRAHECPIVVAGQVSSGKSTLLNLFLGEEILPTDILSCTSTICELLYSPYQSAKSIGEDGKIKPIPFEMKDEFIYKKSEREEKFDHESVKIYLPVTFLKSGIVLVDTPGIGENVTMGSVLPDYVQKHDVFGFIFVIKCDDSGGVLNRFKEMIRQLAAIKDTDGRYKFDPRSVIFVANFWDKVPEKDKPETRDHIIRTLTSETCLKGFYPDEQLFFINSLFAWHTWKAGLISEDFDRVISAIENFFPKGHHRKLELAYSWVETVVLKLMFRVDAYLSKAMASKDTIKSNTSSVTKALDRTMGKIKSAHKDVETALEKIRSELEYKMRQFLQSSKAIKDITSWRLAEIPKTEYGDTWILMEERLDHAINHRISVTLQNWEIEHQFFKQAEEQIIVKINKSFGSIFEELDDIGKGVRSVTEIQGTELKGRAGLARQLNVDEDNTREFPVTLPGELGAETWSVSSMLESLITTPSLLFKPKKTTRQQQMQRDVKEFQDNKAQFMCLRSGLVLRQVSNDSREADHFIRNVVDDQLSQAKDNTKLADCNAREEVQYIKALAEKLLADKRANTQLDSEYQPIGRELTQLFEEVLGFRYRNIEEYRYAADNRRKQCLSGGIMETGCFGIITHMKDKTIRDLESFMQRRHSFFIAKNLKMLSKFRTCDQIARFAGLLRNDVPSIVLDSVLVPARSHMLPKTKRSSVTRHMAIISSEPFLKSVTEGLNFLHIKKLVHLEVSLDNILVDPSGNPKLSHIFETITVPFPFDRYSDPAKGFVYMPPETFPPMNGRYTAAGDMYGLGLLLLELWAQQDIFDSVKKSWTLQALLSNADPGAVLYHKIQNVQSAGKPPTFVKQCLHMLPRKRMTMKEWLIELDRFEWR